MLTPLPEKRKRFPVQSVLSEKKNKIDVSKLKMKFDWSQLDLKKTFASDDKLEYDFLPYNAKEGRLTQIFSLILIWFLSVIFTGFFPINSAIESVSFHLPLFKFYGISILLSVYLFWFFRRLNKRKEVMQIIIEEDGTKIGLIQRIKKYLSVSDSIPLIILSGIYYTYDQKKKPENQNSFLINPVEYLMNQPLSETNPPYYSDLLSTLLHLLTLLIIIGLGIYLLYKTWIFSSDKFKDSFIIITSDNILWDLAYERKEEVKVLRRTILDSREVLTCNIKKLNPDTNLNTLWKVLNPMFVRNIYIACISTLFFFETGLSGIDQAFLSPLEGGIDSSQSFSFIIASIIYMLISCYFCYNFVLKYFLDYYRLRRYLVKNIKQQIDSIYNGTTIMDNETKLLGIKYLNYSLEKQKKSPVLPFDNRLLSFLIFVPLFGQILGFLTVLQ